MKPRAKYLSNRGLPSGSLLLLLLLLLTVVGQAGAQVVDTLYLTCLKDPPRPRQVRSPEFASEKYRAYLDVQATVDEAGNCSNHSTLWVAGGGEPQIAFEQKPTSENHGNGLRIVDWSHDGLKLVVEMYQWEYDSDVALRAVLLYRADEHRIQRVNFNALFSARLHKQCAIWPEEVLGFTPEGEILAKLRDVGDPYRPGEQTNCIGSGIFWAIDATRGTVRPLRSDYQVRHYARVQR